jgi:hypothetical protein
MRDLGLLICILISSQSILAQWERTHGPEGGQITMLETIGDTTYLGTKVKGVYYSIDDGINWESLNAGIYYYKLSDESSTLTKKMVIVN